MRPSTANNEETDLADAQHALDDLRTFVWKKSVGRAGDNRYALQYQLENLEDMLRVVTDSRYARSLGDSGNLSRWNGGETDTLQFIVSTARSAMKSTAETAPLSPRQDTPGGKALKPLIVTNTLGDLRASPAPPLPDGFTTQPLTLKRRIALRQVQAAPGPTSPTGGNTASHRAERATPTLIDTTVASTQERGKSQLRVVNGNPPSPSEADHIDTPDSRMVSQALEIVRNYTKYNRGEQFAASVESLVPPPSGLGTKGNLCPIPNPNSNFPIQGSSKPPPPNEVEPASRDSISKRYNIDNRRWHLCPAIAKSNEPEIAKPAVAEPRLESSGSTSKDPVQSPGDINERLPIIEDSESVLDDRSWVSEPWSSRTSVNFSWQLSQSSSGPLQSSPILGHTEMIPRDSMEFLGYPTLTNIPRTVIPRDSMEGYPWESPSLTSLMPHGTPSTQADQLRVENLQQHGNLSSLRTISARNSLPSFRASLRRPLAPQARAVTLGRINNSGTWKDTCAACYDTLYHITTQLRAPCGHAYCQECSINLVRTYTSQESLHPLRCCNIPIPNEAVQPVLSPAQYADLLEKEREYKTPVERRIYCPKVECRQFIKIGKIASYLFLRDKLKCPACSSWICIKCKEFAHPGNKCGEETTNAIRFEALVKDKGWQRCGKCRRVVERTYGCLHMTCLCGYEFCYRCGAGASTRCGHGVFGNNNP